MLGLEGVLLLDRHPGKLPALPSELVAGPCVLLLALEQLSARGNPLFTRSDPATSHRAVSLLSSNLLSGHRFSESRMSWTLPRSEREGRKSVEASPFQEPYVGHEQIRPYWRRGAGSQRRTQVRMGRPLVDGSRAAVEWWTTMVDDGEDAAGLPAPAL